MRDYYRQKGTETRNSYEAKKQGGYSKVTFLAGMSNLLVSLGHTGRRRVVLGHTLNTNES